MVDKNPFAEFAPKAADANPFAEWVTKQEPRTGEAVKRGFLGASSFGFLDELEGLARAGGLDPEDPNVAHAIGALAVGSYKKLRNDPEAQKLYEEQRDKARALDKSLQEQHPYAYGGGQVAGALALPIAATAKGVTLGARAIAGAKTGAGVGALTGFGEGEGAAGSTVGAGVGAGLGAGLGAAATPVIEGATALAGRYVGPIVNSVRGLVNPEKEAVRQIGLAGVRAEAERAAALARGEPAPSLTPGEFAAEPAARNVDLLGEPGRATARSAANTSPEARTALTQMASDRYEGQGARIGDYLKSKYGDPNPVAMEQTATEAARAANAPNYAKTYAEGDRPIWSPELERLTASKKVQSALESAQANWQDRAVADGFGAMNPPYQINASGLIERTGGKGIPTYPNIQMWDYAARELQNAARAAPPGSEVAGLYNKLARRLKDALDAEVPSYKTTRETAASFFNADNALQAGVNFLTDTGKFNVQRARVALAKMDPAQQQLFKDGYTAALLDKFGDIGQRTNMLNRIAQSENARKELEVVYGKQGLDDLMARLRVESVMDRMRGALGGSTTARQLFEMGLAGGVGGLLESGGDIYHGGLGAVMGAALHRVPGAVGQRINLKVAQRVGELLASRDPAAIEQGIKMVANNKTLQNALERLDTYTARTLGSATPQGARAGASMLPAGIAGSPGDQQQAANQ
jgi:hypothetical protein